MNRRMTLQFTAPAVIIGLLLFGACAAGAWYISYLHGNIARLLAKNVAALQSAQELEMRVRRLRYYCLLYLLDPQPQRLEPIELHQAHFEADLATARSLAETPEEHACIQEIAAGYQLYLDEQLQYRRQVHSPHRAPPEVLAFMDTHPIQQVVDRCHYLLQLNQTAMQQIAADSENVSARARFLLLLVGIVGPVGGVACGIAVARGLNRSILQLSVRIQDIAQHLDRDVGSVQILADGDLRSLDRQLQHVLRRVEEVAERMQQHQREMLRAEQLAAVGQLAASVAHEVRNPLTAVKMLVSLANRPGKPQPLSPEDLAVIHREVERLERTVQNFLGFARLPSPQRQRCDVRGVVEQALGLIRARARQQKVEVVYQGPDEPAWGLADPEQLRTVIVNLALNALDAMPRGGRLTVGVAQALGELRVTVADSGAGIAPDMLPRLFTPFASSKPTGTGLGLSISRRIVEEHDGRLTAENRPEGGACFTISLPALAAADAPPTADVVHA